MARNKKNAWRLSIFKGREAKLNKAIFQTLYKRSPQTIYDMTKGIRIQRDLRHTKYTNVSRRVKTLKQSGYIYKAGIRDTQAGAQATLYQLTTRAHVAFWLNQISPDTLLREADEETLIAELAALILFHKKAETT